MNLASFKLCNFIEKKLNNKLNILNVLNVLDVLNVLNIYQDYNIHVSK